MRSEIAQFVRAPRKPLPHLHHRLHGLSSRDDHGADHVDDNVERRALLIVLLFIPLTPGENNKLFRG